MDVQNILVAYAKGNGEEFIKNLSTPTLLNIRKTINKQLELQDKLKSAKIPHIEEMKKVLFVIQQEILGRIK